MDHSELHGRPNREGIAELPDTGVRNGQLMPGQTARLAAMVIVACIMLAPLVL